MSAFSNYKMQVDWLITWFPLRNNGILKEPRTRVGTFSYQADDPPSSINSPVERLGEGDIDEDALLKDDNVAAYATIGVNELQVFYIDFELKLGGAKRTHRLTVPSNSITPFHLNLRAKHEEEQILNETAIAVQGVVTTGPRGSELIYLLSRLFSLSAYTRKSDG